MKTIIAIAAATLFTTSVSAADIYKDLGTGNPDLTPQRMASVDVAGMQSGIGDGADRYHGFGDDNPDVFHSASKATGGNATVSGSSTPVYVGPGVAF